MSTQDIVEMQCFCNRDRVSKAEASRWLKPQAPAPLSDFEAGRLDGARCKRRDLTRSQEWIAGYDAGRAEMKQQNAEIRARIDQPWSDQQLRSDQRLTQDARDGRPAAALIGKPRLQSRCRLHGKWCHPSCGVQNAFQKAR